MKNWTPPYRGASSRTSGTSQGRRAWPGYHPDGNSGTSSWGDFEPGKKNVERTWEKPWKNHGKPMGEASPDVFFLVFDTAFLWYFVLFSSNSVVLKVGLYHPLTTSSHHPIWPSVWWDVESWDIPSNGFGNPNLGWSSASSRLREWTSVDSLPISGWFLVPIGSMYAAIYGNIDPINIPPISPNVSIYTIHGSYESI